MRNLCTEENCTKEVVGQGLCRKHYMRMKRKGNTSDIRKNQRPLCSEGDGSPAVALGLCDKHYRRKLPKKFKEVEDRFCDWCTELISTNLRKDVKFCSFECKTNRANERRREHPDAKKRAKSYNLKNNFGISYEEWQLMLDSQNGKCKICSRHRTEFVRDFHVDHDHATGKVRGLLCHNCNNLLGQARDDIMVLNKAIEYLTVA